MATRCNTKPYVLFTCKTLYDEKAWYTIIGGALSPFLGFTGAAIPVPPVSYACEYFHFAKQPSNFSGTGYMGEPSQTTGINFYTKSLMWL